MAEDVRNVKVAVGTTATLISPAHKRQELIITNTSTAGQNITVSIGKEAEAQAGIFLTPYAVYYSSMTEGYIPTQGDIWAVASAAGGQLSIFER